MLKAILNFLGMGKGKNKKGGGTTPPPPPEESSYILGTMLHVENFSDPQYLTVALDNFDMFSEGKKFKMKQLYNSAGEFDPSKVQPFMDATVGKKRKGHTLMWSKEDFLPEGYPIASKMGRIAALDKHIQTVLTHFKGEFEAWDVWNEFTDNQGNGLKQPPSGDEITVAEIARALQTARETDPNAKLWVNDFNVHYVGPKYSEYLRIVSELVAMGAPLDGVGFQMHVDLATETLVPAELEAIFKSFTDLGLEVAITECDLRIAKLTGTKEQRFATQGHAVDVIRQACINTSGMHSFSFWGFTDKYSWIYEHDKVSVYEEAPLPFDSAYVPKPAFVALVKPLGEV